MIKCARGSTNLQKTATNTQWYGECLCLLHYKHLYSWWRITQTIPPKRQKISQNTTNWEDSSHKGLRILRLCIMLWKGEREPTIKLCIRRNDWRGSKVHQNTELWTELMVSRWNSSGIFCQDSPHCSSATKSKSSCRIWAKSQNNLQDGSSSCRCSTTFHGDPKKMNGHANEALSSFLCMRKDFHQDVGHSSDLDQKRSGVLLTNTNHKENGNRVAEQMIMEFSESGHPVFRASIKSFVTRNAQKQMWWKIIDTPLRLKLFFRTIISVNKLSIYGAVSKFVWRIKERVERLSQQDRVMKNCTGAGFLRTVDVGQYFMTKDTEEFSQLTDSVVCREYTLPRNESLSEPKGWIRGNTTIGPVLEVTTSYLQGRYAVEIRIESVNKDNSHSWVRISHGLNKLVTDLLNKEDDDNEQETSEIQFKDCALKTNVFAFASRSKAKTKPQRRISAFSSTKTVPIGERIWTDI